MSLLTYPAIVEPDMSGGYGVFFPDLDGCTSGGDTFEAAVAGAAEALQICLEDIVEEGRNCPEVSTASAIREMYDELWAKGAQMALISAEAPDVSERVNVYLPKSLLARIDRFAGEAGFNRSTFFGVAARRYLAGEARS